MCEICEKSFSTATDMKNHFKKIHDGRKNNKCEICSKLFITTGDKNQHIKRVHGKKST